MRVTISPGIGYGRQHDCGTHPGCRHIPLHPVGGYRSIVHLVVRQSVAGDEGREEMTEQQLKVTSRAHSLVGISPGRPNNDFYPTPAYATEALLDSEEFSGIIWEPACGNGD